MPCVHLGSCLANIQSTAFEVRIKKLQNYILVETCCDVTKWRMGSSKVDPEQNAEGVFFTKPNIHKNMILITIFMTGFIKNSFYIVLSVMKSDEVWMGLMTVGGELEM